MDEECREVKQVCDMLQADALCKCLDQCLVRLTEEQLVVGGDLCQGQCFGLGVFVKIVQMITQPFRVLPAVNVGFWVFADRLATTRNLDPVSCALATNYHQEH